MAEDPVKMKELEIKLAELELKRGIYALVISFFMIFAFGFSCYGCYRNTEVDKILIEKGYYSAGPGLVQPLPEKK